MFSDPALPPGNPVAAAEEAAPTPRFRRTFSRGLFLLGLVSLSFVLGAAAMFFELPPSGFLGKAFVGARAWNERRQATAPPIDPGLTSAARVKIDKPGKTFDGFTLCTFASMTAWNSQAVLLNMRGEVVHRWSIPFSTVWPNPAHVTERVPDGLVAFFSCHPYPNGDLLVVFHNLDTLAKGSGLAKLDKDSKLLWSYGARVHHDVDVGEDGTIYAVQQETVTRPPDGLEHLPTPCLLDSLVVLSPEGKLLRKPIPLLEAIRDSPCSPLLSPLEAVASHPVPTSQPADVMHTNCVHVLTRDRAAKFPHFKAGQVLFSVRELDLIGVIDPQTGALVWAALGPWRKQHDPQFLDNGHLLIFDNRGSPRGSRVLEYDPETQAFPWSYAGEGEGGSPFKSRERGMCQRLPNGNTLVVNSEGRELREVTRDKEVVWSYFFDAYINQGRRYGREQLPFLKGDVRARP
jgi:hypothetical protein